MISKDFCKIIHLITKRNYSSSSHEHFLKFVPELKRGIAKGTEAIDFELLNKKLLLIYFSAGWCVTCKDFTPKLKKLYASSRDDVEVLWISRDKSEAEQKEYYTKSLDQNWMFVPLGKPTRDFLKIYKLAGLPSIKLVNKDGNLIEEELKKEIEDHAESPTELVQKWKKQLDL